LRRRSTRERDAKPILSAERFRHRQAKGIGGRLMKRLQAIKKLNLAGGKSAARH
jgi:hypothetical protein